MARLIGLAVVAFLMGLSAPATAVSLLWTPVQTQLRVGDVVALQLVVSGLGSGMADSLGTFDIDLGFNANVLEFESVSFGNQLDLLGLGSAITRSGVTGSGARASLNLFQASRNLPSVLDSMQLSSFTLATVSFKAIGFGTGTRANQGTTVNAMGDAFGNALPVTSVIGGVVAVIPEPAAFLVFATGILILAGACRNRPGRSVS